VLAVRPEPDFHSIKQGDRLAVAVSGGSDSLALLLLTKDFCDAHGHELTALTFDHGLRAESAGEAQWVNGICVRHGIPCTILSWEGLKPVTGIQAKAREARYSALTRWCTEQGFTVLMTAHTRDDQAETVAMRMKRSQSPRSLASIWPENFMNGMRVVRPFLGIKRQELRDYLVSVQQDWLDDPSNANTAFERVRVRQEIKDVPHDVLQQVAVQAQADVEKARADAETWFHSHVTVHPEGYFSLPRAELAPLRGAALEHLLRGLIFALSGSRPKTSDGLARILTWIRMPGIGRTVIAGAIIARRERTMFVMREPSRVVEDSVVIPHGGQVVWDHRFLVSGPPGAMIGPAGQSGKRDKNTPAAATQTCPAARDGEQIQVCFEPKLDFG
jgi:tRNA(Ile)-lysidine synthase